MIRKMYRDILVVHLRSPLAWRSGSHFAEIDLPVGDLFRVLKSELKDCREYAAIDEMRRYVFDGRPAFLLAGFSHEIDDIPAELSVVRNWQSLRVTTFFGDDGKLRQALHLEHSDDLIRSGCSPIRPGKH